MPPLDWQSLQFAPEGSLIVVPPREPGSAPVFDVLSRALMQAEPTGMPGGVVVAVFVWHASPLGFLSPSEALALFGRCFVDSSGCLRSQKALGLFLSLFHANIYSCNCAGGMKTNPSPHHPLPPVFPSPQSSDVDRVQGHKAKSIFSSPRASLSP